MQDAARRTVSMSNNDSTTASSTGEFALEPGFQREQVRNLISGLMPFNAALDFLRQTSEDNIDASTIDLFVEVVSETVLEGTDKSLRHIKENANTIDCCGTGGSGLPHYNTSTTAAFVLAAAGLPTAKFGNRAAKSMSGSFDFLEKIGITGSLPLEAMAELFEDTNLIFLFAQQFYPALATIAPVRQVLGQRTIFNLIGPLLNPARPPYRLLGTPDQRAHELVTGYLAAAPYIKRACVVTSGSGLDELEVGDLNYITSIDSQGSHPDQLYFGEQAGDKPWGGLSSDYCASVFLKLIKNEVGENDYFFRTVCLNTAAALVVAEKVANIDEGYQTAASLIKDGAVAAKFEQYRSKYANHSK
jgi:anthranilate phosphoribosyltransferase